MQHTFFGMACNISKIYLFISFFKFEYYLQYVITISKFEQKFLKAFVLNAKVTEYFRNLKCRLIIILLILQNLPADNFKTCINAFA